MFFDSLPLDIAARALALSSLALFWVVLVVRVVGLRAFSKMTAFDFVVTVATGSLLAGAAQASDWGAFAQSTLGIATLLALQYAMARLRKTSDGIETLLQNRPVLLMRNGEILHEALALTRVSEGDLIAKLREANVLDFREVRAVVLETTGDISVLHGAHLQERLLDGLRKIG